LKIIDASEAGFGGPMTEDEVRNFLRISKKNAHISTIDGKGEPNIHPTWFYFDNDSDKIYIEKWKSLQEDPKPCKK
jgi:hemolysin-activating ACP:hemolysin acyltransferase